MSEFNLWILRLLTSYALFLQLYAGLNEQSALFTSEPRPTVQRAIATLSLSEQEWVFSKTAAEAYGLE